MKSATRWAPRLAPSGSVAAIRSTAPSPEQYSRAIEFLDGTQTFGVKLGLDNIRTLVKALGSPELAIPSVLIAGSNGKGSVASMMTAALLAAGRSVGLYTSPHLVWPEERIAVDGKPIGQPRFAIAAARVEATITELLTTGKLERHPTYFECMTAMGFWHLAAAHVDISVIEVGLGGRFDATNVAEPMVSVVTSIALEHTQYLGTTRSAIAFEKVAIARRGRPLVSGVRSGDAARVIREQTTAVGATLVPAPRRVDTRVVTASRHGLDLEVKTPRGAYPPVRLSLRGRHQERNAAVAIAALEQLPDGLCPTPKEIATGFAHTRWPGRLEYHGRSPRLLLDGAHNPHAARTLAAYLREFEAESKSKGVLLFTCMRDKDVRGLIAPLWRLFDRVVLTEVPMPRCASADELAAAWPRAGGQVMVAANPADALDESCRLAGTRGLVVACGSLYLIGAIKALLG